VLECVEVQKSARHLEDHIQAIQVLNLLIHRLAHALCVLSVRLSLELSECNVCLPCEVILEWIKLYKVRRKPWGLSGSPAIVFDRSTCCGLVRTLCAGDVETFFQSGEAPYWIRNQGDQGSLASA
jgi:hypothetical protein